MLIYKLTFYIVSHTKDIISHSKHPKKKHVKMFKMRRHSITFSCVMMNKA